MQTWRSSGLPLGPHGAGRWPRGLATPPGSAATPPGWRRTRRGPLTPGPQESDQRKRGSRPRCAGPDGLHRMVCTRRAHFRSASGRQAGQALRHPGHVLPTFPSVHFKSCLTSSSSPFLGCLFPLQPSSVAKVTLLESLLSPTHTSTPKHMHTDLTLWCITPVLGPPHGT